jgi:preprotein translocase subunit SecE
MKRIIQFLKEVMIELSKVTWPTRRQAIYMTGIVVLFAVIIGLFVSGVDFGFTKLIQFLSGKIG